MSPNVYRMMKIYDISVRFTITFRNVVVVDVDFDYKYIMLSSKNSENTYLYKM